LLSNFLSSFLRLNKVRGPTVFKEYYQKAEATAKEFIQAEDGGDSWFRTGKSTFFDEISV